MRQLDTDSVPVNAPVLRFLHADEPDTSGLSFLPERFKGKLTERAG